MKYKLLKLLFLAFLFIGQSAYAIEPLSIKYVDPKASEKADSLYNKAHRAYSQGNYEKAIELYRSSYEYKISADVLNNLAATFEKVKDYDNAIKWYKITINKYQDKDAIFNLAFLYDDKLAKYNKAIELYQQAFAKGIVTGGVNLGILYEEKLHKIKKSIYWYKKAIKKGDIDARKNLGLLYHQQKDKLNSATYMIGMIGHPYTKERVLGLLRDDWKIDEPTLKKAYELQKTLVPNPYTGGIE
ncbi:hypothetical protein [Sulfurimonas sp.]|uniref:tetratricopeptide repeat protein n=1 Tax=Sulfurimonas sp. TaxID=2022749 RepID=UPI002B499CD5|nr:hypothetical protein [Sulfurimonas sp.]